MEPIKTWEVLTHYRKPYPAPFSQNTIEISGPTLRAAIEAYKSELAQASSSEDHGKKDVTVQAVYFSSGIFAGKGGVVAEIAYVDMVTGAPVLGKVWIHAEKHEIDSHITKHRIAYKDIKNDSDRRAYENEKASLDQCCKAAFSLKDDFFAAGLIDLIPSLNALIDGIYAARDAYQADEVRAIRADMQEMFGMPYGAEDGNADQ